MFLLFWNEGWPASCYSRSWRTRANLWPRGVLATLDLEVAGTSVGVVEALHRHLVLAHPQVALDTEHARRARLVLESGNPHLQLPHAGSGRHWYGVEREQPGPLRVVESPSERVDHVRGTGVLASLLDIVASGHKTLLCGCFQIAGAT